MNIQIDFSNVKDLYDDSKKSIAKGIGKYYCPCCRKTLDEKNFFKTSNTIKHPSGYLPECRTCVSMMIDDTDPNTFLPVLKELNLPYIPTEWRKLIVKKSPRDPSIIGKYSSRMHLNQFKHYSWADSEKLVQEETQNLLEALRQEKGNEVDAQTATQELLTFSDIKHSNSSNEIPQTLSLEQAAKAYGLTETTSQYHLTAEEIKELKACWGEDYSEKDYLALEQMFQDMKSAYVIQDPIAISNAKIICKMTLKMNRFLDIDDVESVSKISRQLDLFIKSANLAPVQQKDRQSSTFAISQLAFLIEKEGGFIPEWDTSKSEDHIDMILQDMEEYTNYLVKGESNITEMAQNTAEILALDNKPEAKMEDYNDFASLEAELLGDIADVEENQNAFTN